MSWLSNLFKQKKKEVIERMRVRKENPKLTQAFSRIKKDIKSLEAREEELNNRLNEHSNLLVEHSEIIKEHSGKLQELEEIVMREAVKQVIHPTNHPTNPTKHRLVATKLSTGESISQFNLDDFSEQEKKIMNIFIENRDMALSYSDIAKSLDKSANTIKNQIREINMKSDVFERSVDNSKKNRFKLKNGLKIEKTL